MKNLARAGIDLYKIGKKNENKTKNEIVKHFVALGFVQRSVYRWLSKIENWEKLERKKGSGRPVKIDTKSNIQKISRCFDYKSGCSQNRISRRFNWSQ